MATILQVWLAMQVSHDLNDSAVDSTEERPRGESCEAKRPDGQNILFLLRLLPLILLLILLGYDQAEADSLFHHQKTFSGCTALAT